MTTYYIAPTGDDSTGDGSEGNPWYNLNHAREQVGASDTIIAKSGVYNGQESISQQQMRGIQIIGETGNPLDVVLDFQGNEFLWKNTSGNGAGLTPSVQSLTIKNTNGSRLGGARGLFSTMGSNLLLFNVIFDYCGAGGDSISTRGWGNTVGRIDGTCTINRCIFKDMFFWNGSRCGYWGTQALGTHQGTYIVTHNVFVTTGAAPPSGADIINTCIVGNTYGAEEHINKNNIYYFNGTPSYLEGGDTYSFADNSNNCYYNTDYSSGEIGAITDDPLLVDPNNDDYRLRPSSPCIGTGTIL